MRLIPITIWLSVVPACLAQTTASAPTPVFTPAAASPFPAGAYPSAIAVADFSNDGIQDIAVANLSSNRVTVMLGMANGGFGPPQTYAVGTNPVSIAVFYIQPGVGGCNAMVACASLAVANEGGGTVNGKTVSGTVSVLLGMGNGKFAPAVSYQVGSAPVSVAAGNWNGTPSGPPVLVTANFGDNTATVLTPVMSTPTSSGANAVFTGAFSACSNGAFSVGNHPSSVAVGDFNGDGVADFAVVNKSDATVTVYVSASSSSTPCGNSLSSLSPIPVTVLTPATPGYAAPPPLVYPASIVTADFNLDGYLDLAIADEGINSVSILLGDGNGNFGPTAYMPNIPLIPTGNDPFSLAVGYFNDNLYPDLAVTNLIDNTITVLTGSGTGMFTASTLGSATGLLPIAIAVGDFNNDGKPDFVAANRNSDSITVMLNGNPGISTVSAARLIAPVSPGSLVYVTGAGLATTATAPAGGMPVTLGGAAVILTDSTGLQTPLYLLSTSATQIEAYIPTTVNGPSYSPVNSPPATLTVYTSSSSGMAMQTGTVPLQTVAPALFSANGTGEGVASGSVGQPPGSLSPGTSLATCPDGNFSCVPVAVNLSNGGTLTLQGTGLLSAADITASMSGTLMNYSNTVEVNFGELPPITCLPSATPPLVTQPTCTISAPVAQATNSLQSTITLQFPPETMMGLMKVSVTITPPAASQGSSQPPSMTSNIVTVLVRP